MEAKSHLALGSGATAQPGLGGTGEGGACSWQHELLSRVSVDQDGVKGEC